MIWFRTGQKLLKRICCGVQSGEVRTMIFADHLKQHGCCLTLLKSDNMRPLQSYIVFHKMYLSYVPAAWQNLWDPQFWTTSPRCSSDDR